MDIPMIVQTVLFIAIPAVVMLIALLLGLKRNIFQSIAKIVMTLLAIVVSVIITKLFVPTVLVNTLPLIIESSGGELPINLLDTVVGTELLKIVSSVLMPIIFAVVFAIVAFVFWILFIIPKKLLSDKRLAEKTRAKQSDFANNYTEILLEEGAITAEKATEIEQGRSDNHKPWMRVGSIVLSMFSAFLVLAHLALPVSYYSEIIDDISSVELIKESTDEILPIAHSVSTHPVVRGYRAVGSPALFYLDHITTEDGVGDSAKGTLKTIVSIAEIFATLDTTMPNSNTFYTAANMLDNSPFLDNIIVGAFHEILAAWEQEDAWLGIDKTVLGDIEIIDDVLVYLSGIDSASTMFTLVGDVFSLADISNSGLNQDIIANILLRFSPDGLELLEKMLTTALSDAEQLPFEGTEAIISGLFSAIKDFKQDVSITDEQKAKILSNEAKLIYELSRIFTGETEIDPKEIGSMIYSSQIVSDAFNDITDGGTVLDPCNLSDLVEHSFVEEMVSGMEKEGATEDLQKSVLAFFGVK